MPYLILAAGLIFLCVALYRFFLKASPKQVRSAFLAIAATAIGLGALVLAVTGRLPAAIALMVALWPLGAAWLKHRPRGQAAPSGGELTPREAYDILGLEEGADEAQIREAHLRLLKKVHPDQSGSDWLAKRINAARDLLLERFGGR